jgi:TM2 domain-containing membrane protein YozV
MTKKSNKTLLTTLLLCLFLGAIGVHRMYVGKVGSGIVMLLLSISFIGLIVSGIWAIIDFITIATGTFTDGEGKYIR